METEIKILAITQEGEVNRVIFRVSELANKQEFAGQEGGSIRFTTAKLV